MLMLSIDAPAQLRANAGADRGVCFNLSSAPVAIVPIGGVPAATGGTAPYQYRWVSATTGVIAAGLLDDSTIANPNIIADLPQRRDSCRFVLIVTDGTAAVATDTVQLNFSHWVCTLADCIFEKKPADNVWLFSGCSSAFRPFTFRWTPGEYLSDSTDGGPRCWTPVSRTYHLTYADRLGCTRTSTCEVRVRATSVPETLSADAWELFPNPISAATTVSCGQQWVGGTFSLFGSDGRLMCIRKLYAEKTELSLPELPAGLYFYRACAAGGATRYGRLQQQH